MKRRELIRTAFSSLVATTALGTLANAYGAESDKIPLKKVPSEALPKEYISIASPQDIFMMPDRFWTGFKGTLYLGKENSDPKQDGNRIDVFYKRPDGELAILSQPIQLTKENIENLISDKGSLWSAAEYSMAVYDHDGNRIFYSPDVKGSGVAEFNRRLTAPAGYQLIGEIESWQDLQQLPPLFDGAKVKLRSWHKDGESGGGTFMGKLTSAVDDSGVTCSSGKNFHWQRVISDHNELTVFDFGAISDGKTDCADAIHAMYLWAQKNNQKISIKFPAGTFLVSEFDISKKYSRYVRISGSPVSFGYFPSTNIISDGKSAFVFNINARWVELSNINFDGQVNKNKNEQGLYNNVCKAGQYFRGSSLNFRYVGGVAISLIDTLDCKISQWYADRCTGDVIKAVWSDTKKGMWNHNTAIELSNFNVQHCNVGKVLNLPRTTQALIRNGWIEHSDNPGDISDGQWIVDALSMEGCKNPLDAKNSRLNMRQINLQVRSKIDNSRVKGSWLSRFERGSTRIESFGIATEGSMKYNFLGSRFHISNKTDNEQWLEVGKIFSPGQGDSWEIEVFGKAHYEESAGSPYLDITAGNTLNGRANIHFQRKQKLSEMSWSAEGASPVVDVAFTTPSDTDVVIFVKLAKNLNAGMILIKTTAQDRFMSGRCALFDAVLAPQDNLPGNAKTALRQLSLHNGLAGFGANNEGDILLASRELPASAVETSQPQGYISVVINGEQCAMPYFKTK